MDGEYDFGETVQAGSKRKSPLYSLKAVGLSPLAILFCFVPPCSAFWGGPIDMGEGIFVSNLVSRGWSKTSVFLKQSRDGLHQGREREIHSKRFHVSLRWGLVLPNTITHSGPFPGSEGSLHSAMLP